MSSIFAGSDLVFVGSWDCSDDRSSRFGWGVAAVCVSAASDSVREREGVVADDDLSTLCDGEGMCVLDTVCGLGALGGFSGTGGGDLTFGLCPACWAIIMNKM